jgi:hypothetical protein
VRVVTVLTDSILGLLENGKFSLIVLLTLGKGLWEQQEYRIGTRIK